MIEIPEGREPTPHPGNEELGVRKAERGEKWCTASSDGWHCNQPLGHKSIRHRFWADGMYYAHWSANPHVDEFFRELGL